MGNSRIDPFRIEVPDTTLERIRDRIATARWRTTSRGANWRNRVDAAWFRDLVGYWRGAERPALSID